jgi:hypothetical protein
MPQGGIRCSGYNSVDRTPTGKEIHGMKTRRLTTILTSAYLSAMLASSVAPIRSDATLAATIDPSAARAAFQSAVNGLDAAGWMTAATSAAPVPQAAIISPSNPAPKAEPVMTDELLARLIFFARHTRGTGTVNAKICKVLDLCDGTSDIQMRLVENDGNDHFFAIAADGDSKDILFMVRRGGAVETYLTDKTYKLRAAAVLEGGVAHLITNEKAAAKFKQELSLFAGEAGSLPPTGTAVAGNS